SLSNHRSEQLGEAGEGEFGLALDASSPEDGQAVGGLHDLFEQSRFSDTGLATDGDAPTPTFADGIKNRAESIGLDRATDESELGIRVLNACRHPRSLVRLAVTLRLRPSWSPAQGSRAGANCSWAARWFSSDTPAPRRQ